MEIHAKLLNLKIYPKSKHLVSICPHGNQERALTENKILGCKRARSQGERDTCKERVPVEKKQPTNHHPNYQEAKTAVYKMKKKTQNTPHIFEP